MEVLVSMVTILGVLSIGVMSPGPSFILVARTSVGLSRADGLAASAGMGVGSLVFALLTIFGLQAVLQTVPVLYVWLKILGGCYLIFLALRIWKHSRQRLVVEDSGSAQIENKVGSFKLGLFTQLCNPKTAIYYGSVFAALLPADMPIWALLTLAPLIFLLEGGWYALVALLLSSSGPRRIYLNLKTGIDRLASGVMAVLGIRLLLDSK